MCSWVHAYTVTGMTSELFRLKSHWLSYRAAVLNIFRLFSCFPATTSSYTAGPSSTHLRKRTSDIGLFSFHFPNLKIALDIAQLASHKQKQTEPSMRSPLSVTFKFFFIYQSHNNQANILHNLFASRLRGSAPCLKGLTYCFVPVSKLRLVVSRQPFVVIGTRGITQRNIHVLGGSLGIVSWQGFATPKFLQWGASVGERENRKAPASPRD